MKLRDLVYINKSDRNSIIILISVIVVVLVILFLNDDGEGRDGTAVNEKTEIIYPKSRSYIKHKSSRNIDNMPLDCEEQKQIVLKQFDPNTADSTTLLGLGLSRWQVRNIYKYRAHGGVYKQKSDFAQLYGLTVKQYKMIEPYIVISDDYKEASTLFEKEERDTVKYPVKLKEGEHVLLNISDTTKLKKVPGIGSSFARAIIRYGERLGGYVDVSQLMEIEGFPEESLIYFEVSPKVVKKININKESVSKMSRHPYITFFMARTIADHRRLNGPIKDISQLKLNKDFSPEVIERIRPYLEY